MNILGITGCLLTFPGIFFHMIWFCDILIPVIAPCQQMKPKRNTKSEVELKWKVPTFCHTLCLAGTSPKPHTKLSSRDVRRKDKSQWIWGKNLAEQLAAGSFQPIPAPEGEGSSWVPHSSPGMDVWGSTASSLSLGAVPVHWINPIYISQALLGHFFSIMFIKMK